jgi:hypothetical protein
MNFEIYEGKTGLGLNINEINVRGLRHILVLF